MLGNGRPNWRQLGDIFRTANDISLTKREICIKFVDKALIQSLMLLGRKAVKLPKKQVLSLSVALRGSVDYNSGATCWHFPANVVLFRKLYL